jgi:hypothetical protein
MITARIAAEQAKYMFAESTLRSAQPPDQECGCEQCDSFSRFCCMRLECIGILGWSLLL